MADVCSKCSNGQHEHDTYTDTSPEVALYGGCRAGDDAGCPHTVNGEPCACEHINPPKHPRPHCPTCTCREDRHGH